MLTKVIYQRVFLERENTCDYTNAKADENTICIIYIVNIQIIGNLHSVIRLEDGAVAVSEHTCHTVVLGTEYPYQFP